MDDRSRSSGGRERSIPTRVRCAIYTRKSTEEGLDQEFNSLQAQREAAEAYIKSQKILGWTLLSTHYDDGGFSGANIDRPALQQLLKDIEERKVDCVVVYKVDRLSRSLLDFARLMERFDQRSISFVSVTQQFNTTSSLGRLTLNILLSFAQFEREIISERTRDKMSAARRKGKWIGGTPVLGYDVDPGGGRLVVNEEEAARIREIFQLHRDHQSLLAVAAEVSRRGWRNKSWTTRQGRLHEGALLNQAMVRRVLTNAIYIGKVVHHGAIYEGEHHAIIEESIWQEVSAVFQERRREGVSHTRQNTLLAGLLFCASCGELMIAAYSEKRGRRYRYYLCRTAQRNGWASCPTKTVPALRIEDSVIDQLRVVLVSADVREELQVQDVDWQRFQKGEHSALVRSLIEKLTYNRATGGVVLELKAPEGWETEENA